MASNLPMEIASTIQSASIQHNPDTRFDLNPSTAASAKAPVRLEEESAGDIDDASVDEDEIPVSVLQPVPRRNTMPPLPDLRFEQSYLKSIQDAESWLGVGWITLRDQVMLPLIQGTAWSTIVFGWRHWNRASQLSGATVGARIRRWWWGVNNWNLPEKRAGVR